MSSTIDQIKNIIDCHKVMTDDGVVLRPANGHFIGLCPFHADSHPSMHVYPDGYKCYACGAHGDCLDYVMQRKGLEFGEALRLLAGQAGVPLREEPEIQQQRIEHRSRVGVIRRAAEFYHGLLKNHQDALDYLHGRGYRDDFIDSYLMGYTPGNCIRQSGIPVDDLVKYNLLNSNNQDTIYNRVTLPVWGRFDDEIVDIDARTITDARPKYIHLAAPNTLLNARALRRTDEVYLMEGDTDLATAVQAGLPAVGVRGVQGLSAEIAGEFHKIKRIYVVADNDAPKTRDDGTIQEPAGLAMIQKCGSLLGDRCRILTIPNTKLTNGHVIKDATDFIHLAGGDLPALAKTAPTFIQWMISRLPKTIPPGETDDYIDRFIPYLMPLGKGAQQSYGKDICRAVGVTIDVMNGKLRIAVKADKDDKGVHADDEDLIYEDKPRLNPAQSLVNGQMLATVFIEKRLWDDKNECYDYVTLPYVISSSREIFPLVKNQVSERGLKFVPTKVPSPDFMGVKWHISNKYPYSVKAYMDGNVSVQPWDVYSEVRGYFKRWVWYEDERYYDFLSLWTMGTYFFNLFPSYPYVHLYGTKSVGKTLTMNIVEGLAFNACKCDDMSHASLFRTVESLSATMLLDEAENLGPKTNEKGEMEQDPKLQVLKSGYKRGGKVARCVGDNHNTTAFEVYSPKMFGGTQPIDNILNDRIVTLILSEKSASTPLDEFQPDEHLPSIENTRDKLHILMMENGADIAELFRTGVKWDGVKNRARELWGPILTMASFIDAYMFEALGEADDSKSLTLAMRSMATMDIQDRKSRDRMNMIENQLLESVLEYINTDGQKPFYGDWWASGPIFSHIKENPEFAQYRTMKNVYAELIKIKAIDKSNDVATKRPLGALRTTRTTRCVRLDRARLERLAGTMGLGESDRDGDEE